MFENIQDEKLLTDCAEAVKTEKRSTARVLEYLSEIDRRRLWLKEGYSSLWDFCMRYLHYSEGETNRRIQACRLSSRVADVKPLLEENTLSLTTMSMLAPFLTNENSSEILPQVAGQSKKEVEKVLAANFPAFKAKPKCWKVELNSELEPLLEEAQKLASEKCPEVLFKKLLLNFLREKKTRKSKVKKHTRYVQKALARQVKAESGYQCKFVSSKGVRCNQTAKLQTDHVRAWAKGGSSQELGNLRCLCRGHNLFQAKIDFPKFKLGSGADLLPGIAGRSTEKAKEPFAQAPRD